MRAIASLADDLTRLAAPIAGGATIGGLAGLLFGACATAWVGRVVPIERWVLWTSGIGGLVGLVAAVYEQ